MNFTITHIDLVNDWIDILEQYLQGEGYNSANYRREDIPLLHATLLKRRIGARKRKIVKSREFQCPLGMEVGLSNIENIITAGGSLVAYQSKQLSNLGSLDDLLFDWGVHHLHLGTIPDSQDSRYVARTGPLLFAYFTTDTVYFIQVLAHHKPNLNPQIKEPYWADKEVLEIIDRNWPDLIDTKKLAGNYSVEKQLDQNEVCSLRRAGIIPLVQLSSGKIPVLMYGGITTAHTSLDAHRRTDYETQMLQDWQEAFLSDVTSIFEKLGIDTTQFKNMNLDIELRSKNDKLILYEKSNNIEITQLS